MTPPASINSDNHARQTKLLPTSICSDNHLTQAARSIHLDRRSPPSRSSRYTPRRVGLPRMLQVLSPLRDHHSRVTMDDLTIRVPLREVDRSTKTEKTLVNSFYS